MLPKCGSGMWVWVLVCGFGFGFGYVGLGLSSGMRVWVWVGSFHPFKDPPSWRTPLKYLSRKFPFSFFLST
jgi:hypothetical protein